MRYASRSRLARWGSRAALIAGGTICGLIAAELLLRLFFPQPSYFHGDHRFVADPVLDIRLRPLHRMNGVLETNSMGLRDREFTRDKPAGTWRLLCLGDSFTYGDGVSKDETYPKVLERLLRERLPGRAIEVINAGCPSWGTDQEWLYLRDEGLEFQPDMVLVGFFVGNDVIENYTTGENTVINGECIRTHTLFDLDSRFLKWKIRLRLLLERFHLFRLLAYRDLRFRQSMDKERTWNATRESDLAGWFLKTQYLRVVMFWTKHVSTPYYRRAWTRTRQYLADIADLCRREGIRLVVLMIPDETQIEPELQDRLFARFQLPPREEFDFDLPQRLLDDWLESRGIPVVDVLPAFRRAAGSSILYIPNDTHWSPAGHRLAAQLLADMIVDSVFAGREGGSGFEPGAAPGGRKSR